MAKVLDKITLDLNRDVVYGFEKDVFASRITSYVKKALSGSVYPAVEVVNVDDIYWMNNVLIKIVKGKIIIMVGIIGVFLLLFLDMS